ncbi:DUF6053 domain-containing protein [Bifidobacterium longum]|uniref:DUF6053 domain-containing protein n=1 Tax=Bifidobacterium longum TaxID=216816 RepID=UPI0034E0D846
MGGPSGPMLLSQIAADGPESVGPEGPLTNPRSDPDARSGGPKSKKPGRGRVSVCETDRPGLIRDASRSGCGRSARSR